MMTHDQAIELYGPYFKNELSRETVRAFHAHINDCEDCRLRIRVMKAAGAKPGFTLGQAESPEAKLQEVLRKNRIITYAVIAVLVCFFILFRLKGG